MSKIRNLVAILLGATGQEVDEGLSPREVEAVAQLRQKLFRRGYTRFPITGEVQFLLYAQCKDCVLVRTDENINRWSRQRRNGC